MNRFNKLLQNRSGDILSVYFTAGYPRKEDTTSIIKALARFGADMIEIGIPFSDPMADGPVIQKSNAQALKNGMSLEYLLKTIKTTVNKTNIPVFLMGYFNPILQYGFEKLCKEARDAGIDGLIIPDLPPEEFHGYYQGVVGDHELQMIFLITPETPEERIRLIDNISGPFIYLVTSSATTGSDRAFSEEQRQYFEFVQSLNLKNPVLAGFGIKSNNDLKLVNRYFHGAITGSAFIEALASSGGDIPATVSQFLKSLRS